MRLIPVLLLLMVVAVGAAAEVLAPMYLFNCGVSGWTDPYGNVFVKDQDYSFHSAGYVGGNLFAPERIATSAAWCTEWAPLHEWQRKGLEAFRFDLPEGDYLVRLFWMDGDEHGPRLRIMDVALEGQLLFDDLDLVDDAGFMVDHEVSRVVHVEDGTLDVEFASVRDYTLLSAIGVWSVQDDGATPGLPAGMACQDGYGMNCVSWDPSSDFELRDVVIYASSSETGPFAELAAVPYNRGCYWDLAAAESETTYYRIAARDVWGREGAMTRAQHARAHPWTESTLPVFHLSMLPADYDSLNAHPLTDDYHPAFWAPDHDFLKNVEVHYRGGLARRFRKKSWKIELGGDDQYNGTQDLLVIANPDDVYLIRNQLSHKIFDELSTWNAEVSFVHLEFGGEYRGVYDLAEKIGEEFLIARGAQEIGSLYKCYSDMRYLSSEVAYRVNYDKKTGPDDSYADLMDFVDHVNNSADCDFGPWIGECFNFDHFFDYYAMMVYTRQYDFIQRNYYLYFDRDAGLWTIFPWDMTLSFYHTELPLDFGTSASPHFYGNAWNRLYDRILTQPRLRWGYITRLEALHGTILNEDHLGDLPYDLYAEIETDGLRDFHKAYNHKNDLFSTAAEATDWRMTQRDGQLVALIPEFKLATPVVCVNEHLNAPGGASWCELFNYGDRDVTLSDLELSADGAPGGGWILPDEILPPGGRKLLYLDGDPGQGADHATIQPDPAGGIWVLHDAAGEVWDTVRYGAEEIAASQGRQPDGWVTWRGMAPTPGTANGETAPPVIGDVSISPAAPGSDDDIAVSASVTDPGGQALGVVFYYHFAEQPVDSLVLAHAVGSVWSGVVPALGEPGALHWWIVATNALNRSAAEPVGAPYYHHTLMIPDDGQPLCVNEFMADNETTIQDEFGDYEDWLEIYNAGDVSVDLAGYTLTDDLAEPDKWTFPADAACVVPADGYLLVWTDDDDEEGPLHTNFKLSAGGESIGFYSPLGELVDAVVFTAQSPDTSYGRLPNGGDAWFLMSDPSPGQGNAVTAVPEDGAPPALAVTAWPNPFNPKVNLSFANPVVGRVTLTVFDVNGRRVRTLVDATLPVGHHAAVWEGTDGAGRRCASGLYFVRLADETDARVTKIVLLK